MPIGFAHADELQRGLGWVLAQMLLAFTCLARFDEAELVVSGVRDSAIADGDDEVVGSATLVLGALANMRGDLETARRLTHEAGATLHDYDPAGYLPWCLGLEAQIAGQLGDPEAAHAALSRLDSVSTAVRVNDHQVAMGRAWAAAARGETTTPLLILDDAAREACAVGNRFNEGILAHDALRLGAHPRDVLPRLEEASMTGEFPCHVAFLAHGRALASNDGAALDAVCEKFDQLGLVLFAAEAAAEAATVYRQTGHRVPAERAAANATRLAATFGGAARTPALSNLGEVAALTRREREVCRLAADGLSNQTIAECLGVGVRTVEGHLLRGMTKLGVRSRTDLDAALAGA